MKKAKLMLAGIALVATVGSALAFKAQKFTGTYFCTSTQGQSAPSTKYILDAGSSTQLYCSTIQADVPNETVTRKVTQDPR